MRPKASLSYPRTPWYETIKQSDLGPRAKLLDPRASLKNEPTTILSLGQELAYL